MFAAYSFQCYQCNEEGEDSEENCNTKQTKLNCTGALGLTCWKGHYKTDKGREVEMRGCRGKEGCEETKKKCENGDKDLVDDKKEKLTKCAVACCISVGDTPCNGALSFSTNMVMMIFLTLCSSLNLF